MHNKTTIFDLVVRNLANWLCCWKESTFGDDVAQPLLRMFLWLLVGDRADKIAKFSIGLWMSGFYV